MAALNKFLSFLFLGLLSVSQGLMLFFFITPLMKGEAHVIFVVFSSVPLLVMITSLLYPEKLRVLLQLTVDYRPASTFFILTTSHDRDFTMFFMSVLLSYVCSCSLFLGSDLIRKMMFPLCLMLSLRTVIFFFCDGKTGEGFFLPFALVLALVSYFAGKYNFCPLLKGDV